MVKNIINPEIPRVHICGSCGKTFRPSNYYDFNVKCPSCKSENVRPVLFDPFLDTVRF